MSVNGIDVSRWQGNINWGMVYEAGYRFAYIRSTIGNYYTDPMLHIYLDGAEAAGLLTGVYLVIAPAASNGGALISVQAHLDRFREAMGERRPPLPPVLDCELARGRTLTEITNLIRDCATGMHDLYLKRPLIYTAKYWWETNVQRRSYWREFDLWVANYRDPSGSPLLPADWSTWLFWQWTAKGSVPGVESLDVDKDFFAGTLEELRSYAGIPTGPTLEEKVERLWQAHPELWE